MKKLIVLIAIIAGVWYWQKHGSTNKVAFDKDGKAAVVVYTTSQCGPCKDAVNMLSARGVSFQEKEIDPSNDQDKDVQLWREMGNNVFPLTLAGHSIVRGMSKWDLISLLCENFGEQYLTLDEQKYFQRHFDANGKSKVVLYGTDWCPSCAGLRKDFRDNGIDFVDIDVEKSGEFDKIVRVMDIPGYPATWVGYTRVNGVTFSDIKAVMNK
jgi:glutaredoxin